MLDLGKDDERAVERLSFYMLNEAYGATAAVLATLDPIMAKTLFDKIETQIAEALRRIHDQQSEGAASSRIATAVAETLAPILDDSHRNGAARRPGALAKSAMGLPARDGDSSDAIGPPAPRPANAFTARNQQTEAGPPRKGPPAAAAKA